MTLDKEIEIATELIKKGIVNNVYHSVKLIKNNDGLNQPAYKVGDENEWIGPDDTKGRFCYIRSNGRINFVQDKPVTSSSKAYKFLAPLRLILFSANEKTDHVQLTDELLKIGFIEGIVISSYLNDPYILSKEEASFIDFDISGNTLYSALDFIVTGRFLDDCCPKDFCFTVKNPFSL